MIYSLRGTLSLLETSAAVIECSGVGYRCAISFHTRSVLPKTGQQAFLFIHMSVREDAIDLFGFADEQELSSFKLLISVNGVGPKVALALLSDFSTPQLALAIASGDAKALTRTSGVGPKVASRIVLELKDKLGDFKTNDTHVMETISAVTTKNSNLSEAIAALVALGYGQTEAAVALAGCSDTMGVEDLIKHGLKKIARL